MNVLIFATGDFYAKPNPAFHLLSALITDALDAGICIHLVGMSEQGLSQHVPEALLARENFTCSLVDTKPVEKSRLVKRYFSGIEYALRAGKYLKEHIPEADIVFFRSSPTVLFNILSARRYITTQKLIYGIQDMFPGSTIAAGKMPFRPMQTVFYALQRIAYKSCDVITVISEDMKRKAMEQRVPEEKLRVIVNWYDDWSVREIPREENLFIRKYDMRKDCFYVQYAGTMGYVFDYEMVLSVAELLKEQEDIVFQMVGVGSQLEDFRCAVRERGLSNVVFLPLEPQEMVPHVYSACDIALIPLKKGVIGNSVPSKAALLMACRRAVVTTADEESEYCRTINEKHLGIACSADDPAAAAAAILKMKTDPQFREQCADRGLAYGQSRYSRTDNTRKFIELFRELAE